MKRNCLVIMVVVFMALALPAYADQDAKEMFKAVVKIRTTVPKDARTASTLGTEREGYGIVIDSKGHILTIGYLIVEADTIEVIGPDDKSVAGTFVGYDHNTGFGLLRSDKPLDVVPVKMGRSSEVKEGDPVLVAGHGGPEAAGAARVIIRKEFTGYWEYLLEDAIFTFPAYPDFSGAALINSDGELVGVGSLLTQVVVSGIGSIACNIFVPIDLLHPILTDLITLGRPRKAPRPWLGLNAEEAHGRVFVIKVTSEGPSEKAGLKPDDLILAVNGKPVSGISDFYRKVWALGNAGVDVSLSVLKGTEIRNITLHSVDRHQFLQLKQKKI
jgi:serine protease Do